MQIYFFALPNHQIITTVEEVRVAAIIPINVEKMREAVTPTKTARTG